MKNTFALLLILILFCYQNVFSQPLLLETTDEDHRFMLKLNYPSNTAKSSAGIEIKAGLTSNASTAEMATWSQTYTASPGYAGYAGFTNRTSGIILRAEGANGEIRFLTGGGVVANNTRVTIDNVGKMGLGTSSPASKLQLETGDMYVKEIGSGVIIKSPNGSCYRLIVDNLGTIGSQAITCP